jgi:transcriptional regulator with XRE-family HTH domain
MYVKMDGPLVRRMRGSRGFDGAYFARKAGISPKTLRRVERNGGPVRRETARKIGAALDVNPRTLARAILSRPA